MNEPSSNTSVFHAGEQILQEKIGVKERMDAIGKRVIRSFMPAQHQQFYQQLPFVVAGHADADGQVWASVWLGDTEQFIDSPDNKTLVLDTLPITGDPLLQALNTDQKIGLLGIELHSRRRNRLSAKVQSVAQGKTTLAIQQSFGNCPQYIQNRKITYIPANKRPRPEVELLQVLDNSAREIIQNSDTFFVASAYDDGKEANSNGADVSHRGGKPGFVKLGKNGVLTIPDYAGNNFFNTLGNIHQNPNAGLLFIDFEQGHILTMSGKAEIQWEADEAKHFNGALRMWQFTPEKVIWLRNALPFRWQLKEFSPNSMLTGDWEQADSLRQMELKEDNWREFTVSKKVEESAQVSSFYLSPQEGPSALFKAGQFLTVKCNIDGKELIRTYTLSSAPDDSTYRISVKKEGAFSRHLHDKMRVGDTLHAKAPLGSFTLQSERPAVFLAAGIGITPFVSMAKQAMYDVIKTRNMQPITLFYQVRDGDNRPFFDELNQLVEQSGGLFNTIWSMSQPGADMRKSRDFHYKGHLGKDLIQSALPLDDYDFYLCGPGKFIQSQYDLLLLLGVSDSRIFAESFGPAALTRKKPLEAIEHKTIDESAQNAVVNFTSSEVEQAWSRQDGNLLDFAEDHGLTPAFSCRSGQCGSCKVKIIEGGVIHDDKASFPLEKDEALLCCATPAKSNKDIAILKLAL